MKLRRPELFEQGFHLTSFPLSETLLCLIKEEQWLEVDRYFKQLTQHDGELFSFLKKFHEFENIEFIISIRDAQNSWEEDGIWHDDGSRFFAFSLSLTLNPQHMRGGKLGIRRKGLEDFIQIPTPSAGEIIMFLTGLYGFEHKIHKVIEGKRIIIAGWCS